MNRLKRPNEAILPLAARPQFAHTGRRRRVDHLSKSTRFEPGMIPTGLPNLPRQYDLMSGTPQRSSKGHAYRNAVFQALLNTPMFVNFLRMHSRRASPPNRCPLKNDCLTCAMANLADQYWSASHTPQKQQYVEHYCQELWLLCQRIFWTKSVSASRIGPTDPDDEFYPDTFLLHLLVQMRNQLEFNPSEYQTLEKMFTVHTVRRWRCKRNAMCKWSSAPYKWESSLHLDLSVQKRQAKVKQTKVLVGIQRALQTPSRLASRRGSMTGKSKCEKCQGAVESVVEIDQLPEILIVVRDVEELSPEDEPDIPFNPGLNLSRLTSGSDDFADPKDYELVSGVAEHRYTPTSSRNCAFVRGAEDLGDKWFCILDECVVDIGFDALEKFQRPVADGGLAGVEHPPICPEIFIYRRRDYDMRSQTVDSFGPTSPIDADLLLTRDVIARSISEIFTQKIGRGLLKFKVKITPADPSPTDIIEADLKLSYELDGKHYGIKNNGKQNFLALQLKPLDGEDQTNFDAVVSPFEGRVIHRAVQRAKGIYPATQEEGLEQIAGTAIVNGLTNPFAPTGNSTRAGLNAPAPTNVPVPANTDAMDLDPPDPFNSTRALEFAAILQKHKPRRLQEANNAITAGYKFKPSGVTKSHKKSKTQGGNAQNGNVTNRGQRGGNRGGRWGRGVRGGRGGGTGNANGNQNNQTNDGNTNHQNNGNHRGNRRGRGNQWRGRGQ